MPDSLTNPTYISEIFRAAVGGDYQALLGFHKQHPNSPINGSGDTVLHILALNGRKEAVDFLLEEGLHEEEEHGLKGVNAEGNSAVHEAVRAGELDIVKAMVKKKVSLVSNRNHLGETPLFWAALYGEEEILEFLASENGDQNLLRRKDGDTILHAATMAGFYSVAMKICDLYPNLVHSRNEKGYAALHILASSRSSFKSGTNYSHINLGTSQHIPSQFIPMEILLIILYLCLPADPGGKVLNGRGDPENPGEAACSKASAFPTLHKLLHRFISVCPMLGDVYAAKQSHIHALILAKHLIGKDGEWSIMNDGTSPDGARVEKALNPLMLAAKFGVLEVVELILKKRPEAIYLRNDEGKNILHLAMEHRQTRILNYLKVKGHIGYKLSSAIDEDGNTPLHLAANFKEDSHVHGAQQRLTSEISWYKHGQEISPRHVISLRNLSGKRAKDLFYESHKELREIAEKWFKNTTKTFMLIATLIASANFTAAFTAPGDYDEKGFPRLLKETDFTYFMIYTSLALFFCFITVGVSISANLSRFELGDFYISLPFKLVMAATALYYSLIFTITTFTEAFLLIHNNKIPQLLYHFGSYNLVTACQVSALIFLDLMYPGYRYLILVFCHWLGTQFKPCPRHLRRQLSI